MSDRPSARRPRCLHRGLTLVELLVVVVLVGLLTLLALPSLLEAQTRAKISVAMSNQRSVADGLEAYRVDWNLYPVARVTLTDPFGIFSDSALRSLTTPLAYVSLASFADPFGQVVVPPVASQQIPAAGIELPFPSVNSGRALLYIFYPQLADRRRVPEINVAGFAVISLAPDRDDSFIAYYPFPDHLPATARLHGILSVQDTVYDPTNGAVSEGDLGRFGGAVPAPPVLGGGAL